LADKLQFKFSQRFRGKIWNIVTVTEQELMILEIRDQTRKTVAFHALHYGSNSFLWRDFVLEESWWVSLSAASGEVMLFTIYLEQQNPDRKGIAAYDIQTQALRWWNNDFSMVALAQNVISGYSTRLGQKELHLDLWSGKELVAPSSAVESVVQMVTPVHYAEGSQHFDTVKTFLASKLNLTSVAALEYLEHGSNILISYYVMENDLANYLIVLDGEGSVRLHEKLDEHLKGIGLDTFFVLSGCLFFVKNREELVSYFL
jgi:Domain of unknown function (DUF4905)